MKIGFIGMGNMGYALLKGMLKSVSCTDLLFSCRTDEKKRRITEETGVPAAASNSELVSRSDYVILAIKPQIYEEVLSEIRNSVRPGSVYISLAPGKSISCIKEALGGQVKVVRAMPNTPALIGCGMTGVAYDENELSAGQIKVTETLFASVGDFRKVDEAAMSAVVCASGSSPAYVYMFIDALASSAAAKGLPEDTARELVCGAVIGAAKMVLETGEEPDELKKKVCSKGGTTIAGIAQLDAKGFASAIDAATDACYTRSEELAG